MFQHFLYWGIIIGVSLLGYHYWGIFIGVSLLLLAFVVPNVLILLTISLIDTEEKLKLLPLMAFLITEQTEWI